MTWNIEISSDAQAELVRIDRKAAERLLRSLDGICEHDDPRRACKPLRKHLAGLWRRRSGDYRAIIDIQRQGQVLVVVRVGHRSQVYKWRR